MTLRTTLLAAAALLGMVGAANAAPVVGQISLAGYVDAVGSSGMAAASGLDFVQGANGEASPGTPGGITSFGAGQGSFTGLACADVGGGCGVIKDILNFNSTTTINSFLTLTSGNAQISFDLNSLTITSRTPDATGGALTLSAMGTIHFTGYDDTAGVFSLTAQGNQLTSFSATTLATATPEPASLAILGGSLATLGLLRRKKA